jgi:hypothetical protein
MQREWRVGGGSGSGEGVLELPLAIGPAGLAYLGESIAKPEEGPECRKSA